MRRSPARHGTPTARRPEERRRPALCVPQEAERLHQLRHAHVVALCEFPGTTPKSWFRFSPQVVRLDLACSGSACRAARRWSKCARLPLAALSTPRGVLPTPSACACRRVSAPSANSAPQSDLLKTFFSVFLCLQTEWRSLALGVSYSWSTAGEAAGVLPDLVPIYSLAWRPHLLLLLLLRMHRQPGLHTRRRRPSCPAPQRPRPAQRAAAEDFGHAAAPVWLVSAASGRLAPPLLGWAAARRLAWWALRSRPVRLRPRPCRSRQPCCCCRRYGRGRQVALDVAKALNFLHSKGCVHMDSERADWEGGRPYRLCRPRRHFTGWAKLPYPEPMPADKRETRRSRVLLGAGGLTLPHTPPAPWVQSSRPTSC